MKSIKGPRPLLLSCYNFSLIVKAEPSREILQGGTRLLRCPGDRLRLVNFYKCFISCAAKCSDNIYLKQSSDKHNLKNWEKNQNKASMAKAMGPFRDSQAPSWFSGHLSDVPTEIPSHRPCVQEWYSCTLN